MIPYGRHQIFQEDIDSVIEVLKSNNLTQGSVVPRFERSVADYVGASYAVATNSATSALHIAYMALNVGKGDWVWTSPNTFVATSNAALYCGAKVDFVDIDPLTYNISIKNLKDKLKKAKAENKLPKVVTPVHFAGQSSQMCCIKELSHEYGFYIVEDASHAIGGKYLGNLIGDCRFGDITIFSFHPVKIITTGEGGMALTNNAELLKKMFRYRTHGITSDADLMKARPLKEIWNYQQIDLGYNYRMTDIQAALGLSQLKKIDDFVNKRRKIAAYYNEILTGLPIILPWQMPYVDSSYHLYPIRLRENICGKNQKNLYKYLLSAGIIVNVHYIPVYLQPYYEKMGFVQGYCPEAESYYQETISLPIFPSLTKDEQKYVVSQIQKAFD
jgi:UDP-4-amino-4,6-dideoxy-N-acetyl-beta-L-altrosamine transaminase